LAVHHIAHGQLHYLAAAGTRYVLHRNDACRHMPWAGVLADLLADAPLQRGVQLHPLTQLHKEHHAHIPLPLLTDGDRFQHLVDTLHLPVDFRGADAHAAGVEHRVRAPVDDQAAVGPLLGIVTMGPDPGETLEVGGAIAAASLTERDRQWHAGEGPGAVQFALLVEEALALIVPYRHLRTQPRAQQHAAPHRQRRAAEGETGDDIGAAGDGGQLHVRL